MSFIHQRLYKTDDVSKVNMKEYITDLTESLMASYGFDKDNFDLKIFSDMDSLDVDKALPIGLIINEIVTNAFKYAYVGIEHPYLQILFTEKENNMVLSIKDNGAAWNESSWKQTGNSFGRQLVTSLCRQLRAKQDLSIQNGTVFTFTIPQQVQVAS
jgi:two-component sensor histidine kinase